MIKSAREPSRFMKKSILQGSDNMAASSGGVGVIHHHNGNGHHYPKPGSPSLPFLRRGPWRFRCRVAAIVATLIAVTLLGLGLHMGGVVSEVDMYDVTDPPVRLAVNDTNKEEAVIVAPLPPPMRLNFDPALGMLDAARNFKYFPHVLVGSRYAELSSPPHLVTQVRVV